MFLTTPRVITASILGICILIPGFLYVSSISATSIYLPYATKLSTEGVININTESGYRLNDSLSRAELAKIAGKIGELSPTMCTGLYQDVQNSLGDLCGYIEALRINGSIQAASLFRPTDSISRAESVKMLLGVIGEKSSSISTPYYDINGLGDLTGYISRAYELSCLKNTTYFYPKNAILRGEVFEIAACLMQKKSINSTTSIVNTYADEYSINDTVYGTQVNVEISGDVKTMTANALPNHITGTFPNSGNPNTISAQKNTYTFPVTPTFIGSKTWVKEPGIAYNGVKFEPETAEIVSCTSGEQYKIEAIQSFTNLGLDVENAHVQPNGAYHYHGISKALVDTLQGDNLVLLGYAMDGFPMYYSKKGSYTPSYRIISKTRTGTSCTYRNKTVPLDNTAPDGTYVSDWEYVEGLGSLDSCNGTYINGEYSYLVTDTYPYIGRCLNGKVLTSSQSTNMPPPRR